MGANSQKPLTSVVVILVDPVVVSARVSPYGNKPSGWFWFSPTRKVTPVTFAFVRFVRVVFANIGEIAVRESAWSSRNGHSSEKCQAGLRVYARLHAMDDLIKMKNYHE